MSRGAVFPVCLDSGFPRVSGDEPVYADDSRSSGMFSPRERG